MGVCPAKPDSGLESLERQVVFEPQCSRRRDLEAGFGV
jgi:hypothetical protein